MLSFQSQTQADVIVSVQLRAQQAILYIKNLSDHFLLGLYSQLRIQGKMVLRAK